MAGWWCPRLVEGQFLVGQVPGMPNARRSACHRAGALGQGQAPPPGHSPRGPQVRLCPGPGWPWCPRPPWGSGPPCHAWVSPSSKARGRAVNPLPSPGLWGSYVSLPDPWDSRPSPCHVPSESGPAPPCPARTFPAQDPSSPPHDSFSHPGRLGQLVAPKSRPRRARPGPPCWGTSPLPSRRKGLLPLSPPASSTGPQGAAAGGSGPGHVPPCAHRSPQNSRAGRARARGPEPPETPGAGAPAPAPHSLLAFSFLREGRQRMQERCSSRK